MSVVNEEGIVDKLELSRSIIYTLSKLPVLKRDTRFEFNRLKRLIKCNGGLHYKEEYKESYNCFLCLDKTIKNYLNLIEIETIKICEYENYDEEFLILYQGLVYNSTYLKDLVGLIKEFRVSEDSKEPIKQISEFILYLSRYYLRDYDSLEVVNDKMIELIKITAKDEIKSAKDLMQSIKMPYALDE